MKFLLLLSVSGLLTWMIPAHADELCRERISEIICLVDSVDFTNPFATQYNRPCLDGGEKYQEIFHKHFDRSNKILKKMYCSLEKIWIENDLQTTAFAAPVLDESNKVVAGVIGLSRKFLDEKLSFDTWSSSKDEFSFGGGANLNLIHYISNKTADKNFAIFYAINHEFGHLFDYANKLNQFTDCDLAVIPEGCKPLPGSWAEISWLNFKTPLPQNQLPVYPCFYSCGGDYLAHAQASEFYSALTKSGFPSSYATVNPKEDWAEAFALHLAVKEEDLQWNVRTEGKDFNVRAHFDSVLMAAKRKYVQNFLKSQIKYLAPNSEVVCHPEVSGYFEPHWPSSRFFLNLEFLFPCERLCFAEVLRPRLTAE
jgi:hypothetical protein